jgi:ribonuclease P protein component
LFDRNRSDVGSIAVGCVRLLFRVVARGELGLDVPVQAGFSPGRYLRKAVARNRIKRLLREVYRVNQHLLVDLFSHRGDALTLMVLSRARTPEAAQQCFPRDLPEAMRQLAARLRAPAAPS